MGQLDSGEGVDLGEGTKRVGGWVGGLIEGVERVGG